MPLESPAYIFYKYKFYLNTFYFFKLKLYPFFTNDIINIIVTTACALIVARAAPITPSFGNPKSPNINIGSNIMLEANPIVFIKKGILLLPEALKIPVNNGFKS